MKASLLTSALLICFLQVSVAQIAALRGRVLDSKQQPVEYATVTLLSGVDSTFIKGTLTDTTGRFVLPALAAGSFLIRITAVGLSSIMASPITLTTAEYDLGVLTLQSGSQTLTEVIVKGERPVVERTMGRLVLNVTNSFFKTATNALDVLRRAPGLIVGQDGTISIKGQYAPVVYIDGLQQPLTADELRGLQAGDIDQIEVISNASAQFDGSTRAVINIKLKRDKTLGGKGSLYSTYVQNQRYNGGQFGGSSTYKTKKWAYYGRLDYSLTNNFLIGSNKRIIDTDSSQTVFAGASLLKRASQPLSYQFSADFSPAADQQIGLFVKGATTNQTDQLNSNSVQTDYTQSNTSATRTLLNTYDLDQTQSGNIAIDINYKGTLNKQGDQLSAFIDYASYQTAKTQNFRNDFLTAEQLPTRPPLVLFGQFPSSITIQSLRVDYVHPLGKKGKLEAGTKLTHTNTDNELRYDTLAGSLFVRDPTRSNRFLYDEQILAGYGQLSQEFGKTQLEAGLRVEDTRSMGNSLTLNNVVNRHYFRWLPTLKVQYKVGKQDILSMSYTRKLSRPNFYELNPFTLYLDPYSFTEGNPFLLPTTYTTADLTYQHGEVTISLNYQRTADAIVQMPFQDDKTRNIRYTRVNLDTQQSVWGDVSATQQITKKWKMQHYATVGYEQTISTYAPGQFINTGSWNAYVSGTHNFMLPKGYNLELNYYYASPRVSYIYYTKSTGTVSLGCQKTILANRGNLQLNLNDIFNNYREYFVSKYSNLDVSVCKSGIVVKPPYALPTSLASPRLTAPTVLQAVPKKKAGHGKPQVAEV